MSATSLNRSPFAMVSSKNWSKPQWQRQTKSSVHNTCNANPPSSASSHHSCQSLSVRPHKRSLPAASTFSFNYLHLSHIAPDSLWRQHFYIAFPFFLHCTFTKYCIHCLLHDEKKKTLTFLGLFKNPFLNYFTCDFIVQTDRQTDRGLFKHF